MKEDFRDESEEESEENLFNFLDTADEIFDTEEDTTIDETEDFSNCIKYAKTINGNAGIEFDFDSSLVIVRSIEKRIGETRKFYHFKNQNDESFIYFQNITRMLQLLSKYNYPVDIRFKNLDDATSDLIFLYEGQEVELQDIEILYNSLNKRLSEIGETDDKKLLWNLYYSGEYKNVQEQDILVD